MTYNAEPGNNSSRFVNAGAGLTVFAVVAFVLLWAGFKIFGTQAVPVLKRVTVDFAYYNPSSLVLKNSGWLEEAFKQQGIEVKWVQSAGSNRALQYLDGTNALNYLTGDSVQFGSTAGLSAVLARTNGSPIKAVYVYSRPEWTALVVSRDSTINSVEDLRGRKIAATRGTDPYLFLMRTLHEFGVSKSDVDIVNMQHADGRAAMEQLRVDAWAGLDPHMAASELDMGGRLIYRNIAFNTYGFLNVPEKFASEYPAAVKTVIENYERARKWILANPETAANLLANEAGISIGVARRQLERNDFSNPVIGQEHIAALRNAAHVLVENEMVKSEAVVNKAIAELIDSSFVEAVVK